MRYEVDARLPPRCWAAFQAFEGPEAKAQAVELARSFAAQGFGFIRVLQASSFVGGKQRIVWLRGSDAS